MLLLDEPLGALDLKLRRQMQLVLKQVQSRVGITFLYVTHDQEEAFAMSDRVGVMSGGILTQVGTPQEIYGRPRACSSPISSARPTSCAAASSAGPGPATTCG